MEDFTASTPPLSPYEEYKIEVVKYVWVGTMGALAWDILSNLGNDYVLLRRRFALPSAVYILSRVSTFGYVLSSVIYGTAPLGDVCRPFLIGLGCLYPLAISSTAFLFFLRVRAVFNNNKWISAFFLLMWFAVVVCTSMVLSGLVGASLPSKECRTIKMNPSYALASAIMPVVNDTLIFFAIAWKLTQNSLSSGEKVRDGLSTFIFGRYLPRFSRALLQGGQIYYLTTVTLHIATIIMVYGQFSIIYQLLLSLSNAAVMNMMACAVFRYIKLGCYNCGASTLLPMSFKVVTKQDSEWTGEINVNVERFVAADNSMVDSEIHEIEIAGPRTGTKDVKSSLYHS